MSKEIPPLTIYHWDNKPFILASDLFKIVLPYSYHYYTHWVRINITHQPQGIPVLNNDYLALNDTDIKLPNKIKGGKKRIEYLISPLFGIQLCYQTKTIPCIKLKEFLSTFI